MMNGLFRASGYARYPGIMKCFACVTFIVATALLAIAQAESPRSVRAIIQRAYDTTNAAATRRDPKAFAICAPDYVAVDTHGSSKKLSEEIKSMIDVARDDYEKHDAQMALSQYDALSALPAQKGHAVDVLTHFLAWESPTN